MICTFFGHRNTADSIATEVEKVVIDLLENKSVDVFYVGNQGNFDNIVYRVLEKLSDNYVFKYYVVLAYLPCSNKNLIKKNTIVPDGVENVPKRFAIKYVNNWMIDKSNYVVAHAENNVSSCAYEFMKNAERKNKIIIKL